MVDSFNRCAYIGTCMKAREQSRNRTREANTDEINRDGGEREARKRKALSDAREVPEPKAIDLREAMAAYFEVSRRKGYR